jgi:hypothetical protein
MKNLPILNKGFLYEQDIFTGTTLAEMALTLILCCVTYLCVTYEHDSWYYYCTNWGHQLTFMYYFLSVVKSYYQVREDNATLSYWTSLCLHLSCSFQFMIFVFYWLMLSREEIFAMLQYEDKNMSRYFFFMGMWRHLANPLLSWIPLLTCRTKFHAKSFYILLGFATCYMYFNYRGGIAFGKPVYSVIDWKSTKSHIYMALGTSLSFVGFYLSLRTSQAVNRRLNAAAKLRSA